MEMNQLYRSKQDKIIMGVCGGLAKYFNVDSIIPRIIFIALTVGSGVGVLVYILMAILVPAEDGSPVVIDITDQVKNNKGNRRFLAGVLIVVIGGLFLLQQISPAFSYFMHWRFLVPLLLIAFGISLLIKRSK